MTIDWHIYIQTDFSVIANKLEYAMTHMVTYKTKDKSGQIEKLKKTKI